MASSDAVIEDMDIAVDTENSREYELARMRHSAAHLMAEAVQEVFPDAKFGIGPAIENGLYYDFDLPRPLTPDDLSDIEARMRKHQKADDIRAQRCLPRRGARDFGSNPNKVEIIEELPEDATISTTTG